MTAGCADQPRDRSGLRCFLKRFRTRQPHWQNSSLLIPIDGEKLPEDRFHHPYGTAHLMEPLAPELLNGRNLSGVTDLAQDIFAERRYVETTHHRGSNVRQIDSVIQVD